MKEAYIKAVGIGAGAQHPSTERHPHYRTSTSSDYSRRYSVLRSANLDESVRIRRHIKRAVNGSSIFGPVVRLLRALGWEQASASSFTVQISRTRTRRADLTRPFASTTNFSPIGALRWCHSRRVMWPASAVGRRLSRARLSRRPHPPMPMAVAVYYPHCPMGLRCVWSFRDHSPGK